MASLKHLIKKMFEDLEAQKRDINQLNLTTQHAVTDIYRANNYVAQLQGILSKIDSLLDTYERLKGTVPEMAVREKKQYAQLLNDIATELQFMKAVSSCMDDNLKKLKESGNIEHTISGNIIALKRRMNKALKKIGEILSVH